LTHPEHPAKTSAPSRTGRFAGGFGLLRGSGSSAPAPRLLAALALATAALLTLGAGSVSAAIVHSYSSSFGEAGSGAGQFEVTDQSGVAVNPTTGDVYLADTGNGRVDQFEANGTFIRSFGSLATPTFLALDPSSGDLYVADSATDTVAKFEADGTAVTAWGTLGVLDGSTSTTGAFGELDGLAINAAGDLMVLSGGTRIDVFAADGSFLEEFPIGFPAHPLGFAVDASTSVSAGDIYTFYFGFPETLKFTPTGGFIGEPDHGEGTGLTVDPSNGDLYVDHGTEITRYDAEGTQLETFGSAEASGGELSAAGALALDAAHDLYVVNVGAGKVARFAEVPLPAVTTGQASGLQVEGQATLNGSVNPEGVGLSECQFEYVTSEAFETTGFEDLSSGGSAACEPPAASIPVNGQTAVHADISGLTPRTTYRFRLSAANPASGPVYDADHVFFAPTEPEILSTSASGVTAGSALLQTELNPEGQPTTFHFEYGTTTAYGSSTPNRNAGSGTAAVALTEEIQALLPGTSYHFRVIAENALGELAGEDREFTTQGTAPVSLLPDGRQWELVSPPDKQGALIEGLSPEGDVIQAAADGSAITYGAAAPITSSPAGSRSFTFNQVLSRRGATGWGSEEIATANEEVVGWVGGHDSEYQIFANDLTTGIVQPFGATLLSPQATEKTPYRRESDGTFLPLVTANNVPAGVHFGGGGHFFLSVQFVTATPDQSRILLASCADLTDDAIDVCAGQGAEQNLYEWSEGALQLVSILPDGHSVTSEGGIPQVGFGGYMVRHALSDDGRRVIFEVGEGGSVQLYLRDVPLGQTVRLGTPEAGLPPGGSAQFQTASSDGSRIFFTDTARLTADATVEEERPDLYECEVKVLAGHLECALTDLTVDSHPGESAEVLGLVTGADDSGRYVYFVANGRLAEGAVPGDCPTGEELNRAQRCNLYVRDTLAGTTRLVAVLDGGDRRAWQSPSFANLSGIAARVSPDGRFLAFMSDSLDLARNIAGYDNRDAVSGQPDEEVYLDDSAADGGEGKLICASCRPTGARPRGVFDKDEYPYLLVDRRPIWRGQWLAGSLPGWTAVDNAHALYQSRYLSNSGRLFFNAGDALVPQDTNGTEDVYQYEPAGVGGCTTASPTFGPKAEGCVDLISSGTSGEESAFLDASESGDDVFFLTASQLAPQDTDAALDVYDAHVCSSASPCPPTPLPPPPACEGDSCQPPAVPPGFETPGTALVNGPGNLLQCPKGKVMRRGKCVTKHKAKKHHKRHRKQRRASSHRGGHK
jgi:DNA-binding beta-propeller fold protein YncE